LRPPDNCWEKSAELHKSARLLCNCESKGFWAISHFDALSKKIFTLINYLYFLPLYFSMMKSKQKSRPNLYPEFTEGKSPALLCPNDDFSFNLSLT